ncbi:MAG: hypothetical protein QOH39_299 [Verrucomicrobiota bacterium]|jgi:hypothetical protein
MNIPAARSELDSMVVEIELTLISIIQGVALTFLIESSRDVISFNGVEFWPYIVAGLLLIFVFWSRSVLHIITVIRWPLEFGHNFLYIACALVEALLFTRLHNPKAWFGLAAVFGAIGWLLFTYDLRLIRAREKDSAGEASDRLVGIVRRDQLLNIAVLVPGVLVFNFLCFLLVRSWPDLFLRQRWHMCLAGAQVAGFAGYLWYVLRYFKSLAPLIAQARAEWRAKSVL